MRFAQTVALSAVVSACVAADPAPASLSALVIDAPSTTVALGASVQLSAVALLDSGARTTTRVQWSSDDDAVASVDDVGVVHARAPGRVTIEAAAGAVRDTLEFEITSARVVNLAVFPSSLEAAPLGLMPRLRAAATFTDGSVRNVTSEVDWNVEGATSLSERGHFRLSVEGTARFTAHLHGRSATKRVVVGPPIVASVTLEPQRTGLRPGETTAFVVRAFLTDDTSRTVTGVAELSSLDESIAVIRGGSVVALAPGVARLAATFGGVTTQTHVTVLAREVLALHGLVPQLDLPSGRTARVQVIATFDDGSAREVTNEVHWTSESPDVAILETGGVVRARSQGTARLSGQLGAHAVTTTIVVHPPVLEGLRLSFPAQASTRLVVGQIVSLAVLGRFSDGVELNVSPLATLGFDPTVDVKLHGDLLWLDVLSTGSASLLVEVAGHSATAQFALSPHQLETVRLEYSPADPLRLVAIATYADGAQADVSEQCEWSTSSSRVAIDTAPGARGALRRLGAGTVRASILHRVAELQLAQ